MKKRKNRNQQVKQKKEKKQGQTPYFNPYDTNFYPSATSSYETGNTYQTTKKQRKQQQKQQLKTYTTSSKQRMKSKKRRKKARQRKMVVAMCTIVVFVWGVVKWIGYMNVPTVSYEIVKNGTLDTASILKGLIIREEKVYYHTQKGEVHYIAGEGEKVGKNGQVCAIVDSVQAKETSAKKTKATNALYDTAEEKESFLYYQDEIYKLDKHIEQIMDNFYNVGIGKTTEDISWLRQQLDASILQRTNLYTKEKNESMQHLSHTLSNVNQSMKGVKQIYYAEKAGIVSYLIDGQEENLVRKDLEKMDYKTYKHYLSQKEKVTLDEKKGMPLYKLVISDVWNIVTYMRNDEAGNWKEGEVYPIHFQDSKESTINFKLIQKKKEGNYIRFIWESNEFIADYMEDRLVSYTIGDGAKEGLKIPIEAITQQNVLEIPQTYLVERENKRGVLKQVGDTVEFVQINTIATNEKDILWIAQNLEDASGIRLKDTIIDQANKKTYVIDKIHTIEGVYVMNGKLAQFKPVEILATNEEYVIIKDTGTGYLKELDKIIANPKSIKQDQLLNDVKIQNE